MALGDFFLKIDGVPGESFDSKHKDEIQLSSFSWGVSQAGTTAQYGGGGGAGKASFQDFHFTMTISKASPLLMKFCANGKHIPKAVLTCRKAGEKQQEYQITTFTDILISSFMTNGSGHSDVLPTESISFNFAKLETEYKVQNKDGTLGAATKAGYNIKENKEV
ncbi:MAG: type VI secretion system tube protein Hcp [Acidobacteriota bacterium]